MRALVLMALMLSPVAPVFATNMELQTFYEICEITGELKESIRYVEVEQPDLTIEEIELQ